MNYIEQVKDVFSVSEDYYLAHCISADFALGKGIAVTLNHQFDMKKKLEEAYPNYLDTYIHNRIGGDCLLVDRVFNLVTKERYFHKPNGITMHMALQKMKEICMEQGIQKIAMPCIGAGLDRLSWKGTSQQIQMLFKNTEIEILVCRQEGR